MSDHETSIDAEGTFVRADVEGAVDKARALHHLATADPEPERDGPLTGPEHEERYGLERAAGSKAAWEAVGARPIRSEGEGPEDFETTEAKHA